MAKTILDKNLLTKVILGINGVAFLGFGLACFFDPTITANLVGYELSRTDAWIEVRAMYGGIQTIIGIYMLLGLVVERYREPALVFLILAYSGLAIGRWYGLAVDVGEAGIFTFGAVGFETVMAIAGAIVWIKFSASARAGSGQGSE